MSNPRTLAREFAFQFLFHLQLPVFETVKKELLSGEDDTLLEKTLQQLENTISNAPEGEPKNFSITMVKGVIDNYYSLLQKIETHLDNWKMDRLSKVDLTILLLATYEISFYKQTPHNIVINEALELAKRFSTKESSAFVNGVLDRIHKADS